jgi:hypothetical protein
VLPLDTGISSPLTEARRVRLGGCPRASVHSVSKPAEGCHGIDGGRVRCGPSRASRNVQAATSAGSICAATTRSGGMVTVTAPSRSSKNRTLTRTMPITAPDSS